KNADPAKKHESPSQMDYLIREISTPRCKYYLNKSPNLVVDGEDIKGLPYDMLFEKLTSGLEFRPEHPGDHINIWDFNRLKQCGNRVGFKHIVRSKPGGCVSLAMQGSDMDRTYPRMSLYVDMVK
ncbi:MAG: hypothetical protein ACLFRN_11390, partial [Halothece sp.]